MILAQSAGLGLIGQDPGSIMTTINEIIEFASLAIEVLAVAVIIIFTVGATYDYVRRQTSRGASINAYDQYKIRLARGLLLGLEILVAADIVRTVALEFSLENVVILGILVLIRTFLSWSLVVEIEHRWPWQRHKVAQPETAIPISAETRGGGHA
jgi:uncharacterized membrane protein